MKSFFLSIFLFVLPIILFSQEECICSAQITETSECTLTACFMTNFCDGPATFSWEGPKGAIPGATLNSDPTKKFICHEISAVGNGTYCVTITDVDGCSATDCFTVEGCEDNCNCNVLIWEPDDCVVRACVNNGRCKSPQTFSWDRPNGPLTTGPSSTALFFNCSEISPARNGQYCVTVTDADGCTAIDCITVDSCEEECEDCEVFLFLDDCTVSAGHTHECIQGGEWNFTYNGNPVPAIGPIPANLDGLYCVQYIGPTGCEATDCMNIIDCQPDPCEESNCTARIYQRDCALYAGDSNCDDYCPTWILPDGTSSTDAGIPILQAGEYCLLVTDENGCTDISCLEVEPCEPSDCDCSNTELELEPYNNTSYPDCCSYKVRFNVDEECTNNAVVFSINADGKIEGFFTSNVNTGTFQVVTVCPEGVGPFPPARTQEYYLNGELCHTHDFVCCEFEVELDHTDALCMMANGAVGVIDHPQSGYTYNWESNGVQVGTTAIVDCLPAGTYEVTVTDPDGCKAMGMVTVDQEFTTIINEEGGETGLAPDGNPIKKGLKFEKGQELTWRFKTYHIPDEMIIEWAPNDQFNSSQILTLIDTGPVSCRGSQCCTWQTLNVCTCDPNILLMADHVPGVNLPIDGGVPGPGIDFLDGQAFAKANPMNSTTCSDNAKSIIGCVTVPDDGWVRLLVNPDLCMAQEITFWEVEVSCDCTIMLQDEDIIDTRRKFLGKEILLYPNPSTGLVYFDQQNEVSKVEVYNSTGKLCKEESGIINSIDLSTESPGIYLFKITGSFGTEMQKIIITR